MTQSGKSPEGQVADAVKDNWVDRLAPAASRPYLRLSRADRPIGTWLLYIPCMWGVLLAALHDGNLQLWDAWLILASGAGAWLMRGAGCASCSHSFTAYPLRASQCAKRYFLDSRSSADSLLHITHFWPNDHYSWDSFHWICSYLSLCKTVHLVATDFFGHSIQLGRFTRLGCPHR